MKSGYGICAFFVTVFVPNDICARFALGFDADYISQANYQSNTAGFLLSGGFMLMF